MKRLLNMTAMIYLSLPSLWADEYDIWELEYDSVFSKCMAKIVEFPGHKIAPPLHTYEDEEDRISGEKQFASEGVEGSIDAYLRSKPIAQNVSIDKDLSKIYQDAIEHIDDEKDSPFLGVGQDYLFFNKQKKHTILALLNGMNALSSGTGAKTHGIHVCSLAPWIF